MTQQRLLLAALTICAVLFVMAAVRLCSGGPAGSGAAPTKSAAEKELTIAEELEKQLGLVKLRLPPGKMKVVFQSEARCKPGDLDEIRNEWAVAKARRLIVTLEPMDGDEGPLARRDITPDELQKGLTYEFNFPPPEGAMQAGIYLCLDGAKSGRCRDKRKANINADFTRHALATAERPALEAVDQVYFFQYVLLDRESATMFSGQPSATAPLTLTAYATARAGANAAPEKLGPGAEEALGTMKTLRSLPLGTTDVAKGGEAIIKLPYFDKGACEQGGAKNAPAGANDDEARKQAMAIGPRGMPQQMEKMFQEMETNAKNARP